MGSLGLEVAKKAMWFYPKVMGFNPFERYGHYACYSNGFVYVFWEGFRGDDIRNSNTKTLRAETRTGCLTRMLIQVSKYTHKFEVTKFVESHNHPLMIDECLHMLPSQRRISRVQAFDLELASDSGINPRNSYELMGRQAGGKESVGYMKLDLLNHIRTRRQTELEYGEAA
ncbi:protein FAR1-RELATED SEQUENCE 5-like [Cornus florida]|uniref:protein FAR1-RELATED SEQUENCE 5-like n=1 Tax=Cornus florida TaxID=4283 RepID=UPI0028990720|nr:protein FAR1-RELATED SEQUENCE 5-like [Cornus florida]